MQTIYVNENIPAEYKYITNITDTYFDLYDKPIITGTSGTFYRIYYGFNPDIYTVNNYDYTEYGGYTTCEVKRSTDILSRSDIPSICIATLSFSILIVFLFNIMTSIIKKGGVLSA